MKYSLTILFILVLSACSSTKSIKVSPDGSYYLLPETSTDSTYGYTQGNPIKVGKLSAVNERKYINSLAGPNDESLKYYRIGSCCHFKTPHALIGGYGLLDKYAVFWENSTDTLILYINVYDEGSLKIPKGLKVRK